MKVATVRFFRWVTAPDSSRTRGQRIDDRDDMKSRSVVLQGARWRMAGSVMTILASALAFAAAVLAPLYLRATGDSVLRSTVTSAPIYQTGVNLNGGVRAVNVGSIGAAEAVVGGRSRGQGPKGSGWFDPPQTAVTAGIELSGRASGPYPSALFNQTGICAHIVMLSGRCSLGPGIALLSARSAANIYVANGDLVKAAIPGEPDQTYKLVGIYATPNFSDPYWWNQGASIFDFGSRPDDLPPALDPLIVSHRDASGVPARALPTAWGDIPLRVGKVRTCPVRDSSGGLSPTTARRCRPGTGCC